MRGAAKSGLPVFIGISTRLLKDGRLVLWGDGTDEMPVRAWPRAGSRRGALALPGRIPEGGRLAGQTT